MKKLFAAFLVLATVACAAGCNASVTPERRYAPGTNSPYRDTGLYGTDIVPGNNVIIP